MLGPDAYATLAILAVLFILLIISRLPVWVIFVGALTCAMTFGLASPDALLKGFSNPGVLSVAVLFMVAYGMYSTGAIIIIVDTLLGFPHTINQAFTRILFPIAGGSAFLNNTPLIAMMIPVIRDITRNLGLPASRFYIPLSFASILGGATTLIGTSTNLIIAGLVTDYLAPGTSGGPALQEIGMFTPTPVGLPVALIGIVFIILTAPYLLPEKTEQTNAKTTPGRLYEAKFIVGKSEGIDGKTLEEVGFSRPVGFEIKTIERPQTGRLEITPELQLQEGDIITFWTDSDTLPHLWSKIGLRTANETFELSSDRHLHHLVEVVISPKNPAAGKTISQIHTDKSSSFGGNLVALSRGGKPVISENKQTFILQGDNAILEVQDEFFYENRNEERFKLIRRLKGYHIKRTDRAAEATIITACMITTVALQWLPLLNAALLAVFAMLLTGCMSIGQATKSIDLQTIVILACAIGLESALTETGLSWAIADIIQSASGTDPYLALAAIFIGAVIMTNVITNPAAAAFMFPIAFNLAVDLGVSFMPFVIVLMLGCSYAFINPAGYQTNMMVYEPGGYTTRDYIRTGLPLTIIVGITTLLLTPIFFPF
ncbi:SLC13 family permease [Methanogenium cariaci]|jgi:di/tricarboxylate transporter